MNSSHVCFTARNHDAALLSKRICSIEKLVIGFEANPEITVKEKDKEQQTEVCTRLQFRSLFDYVLVYAT